MNFEELQSLQDYLYKHSALVVVEVDEQGFIRTANRFAQKMAGKELKGRHLDDFFVDFTILPDVHTMLGKGILKQLMNVNTAQGLPQTIYFTSIRTGDGLVLVGETDHEELELLRNTMVTLNNELNNLARELQKKNIELDKLNKLKNQFLGMAAHDLRNPIGSIMSFSEFILETRGNDISPDLKRMIDIIRSTSRFMLRLLDELLDVVKIESGKMDLNLSEIFLADFLLQMIRNNAILAGKKQIDLKLHMADHSLKIVFDADKIAQVMNNLISNAIKYSPQHTSVKVSAFETSREIIVSVQDQGQGIPKKEMNLLFKPFAKISVKGTEGEKSTGLGLSIAKQIIIGHRGRIWAESEEGKGSTFYFSIPLNRAGV